MSNFITTDWLNLRSEPYISKGNVIAIMPPETIVEQIDSTQLNGWVKIKTILGGSALKGYAAEKYLELTDLILSVDVESKDNIPPVHLNIRKNQLIKRDSTNGRAFPLNEPGLLKLELTTLGSVAARKAAVQNVIDYLDVEHKARYSPTTKNTFCNIYAYDVAYCLGAFLPRVWWNELALAKLKLNQPVEAIYDKTLRELNANALTDWFEKYSNIYGWQRVWNVNDIQQTVNSGTLGIIVAQRINLNRSGHIVAVVPEDHSNFAKRSGEKVTSPLQSQAGINNRKYFTGNNWWEYSSKFRKFGFYTFNPS